MPKVFHDNRRSVQVIDGNVKVALNLWGVQVERQCAACAGCFEKVGDELRRYRDARLIFAVLSGVAVVRQYGGDTPGGCTFEGINHQEQLEQVVVHRIAARLNHEDVGAAHVFEDLKINLAIAEASQAGLTQRYIQMRADALCQRQIRGPREDFKPVVVHDTRAPTAQLLGWPTSRPKFASNYRLVGSLEALRINRG